MFVLCHVSSYRCFPSVDDDKGWLFFGELGAIVCRESTHKNLHQAEVNLVQSANRSHMLLELQEAKKVFYFKATVWFQLEFELGIS